MRHHRVESATIGFMLVGVACFAGLVVPTVVDARNIEMTFASTESITNSEGATRVLLDLGRIPSEIRGELVTSAFLIVPVPRTELIDDLVVLAHRVTTPWVDRQPDWDTPWRVPGGDFDTIAPITDVLWREEGREGLSFDVTEMIRDIADGEAEDCGFLLTVPEHRGDGLRSEELVALGSLEGARLSIVYSSIKHLGFNGSRSIVERAQLLRAKAAAEERAVED